MHLTIASISVTIADLHVTIAGIRVMGDLVYIMRGAVARGLICACVRSLSVRMHVGAICGCNRFVGLLDIGRGRGVI